MERKKFRDDHKAFKDNQLESRKAVLEVFKSGRGILPRSHPSRRRISARPQRLLDGPK